MKYYFNFMMTPDDTTDPPQASYRMPTDPQYKQDGVYNQRCMYKITSFNIHETTAVERSALAEKTIIIRIRNCPCMNIVNLCPASGFDALRERPIEFHIRMGSDFTQFNGTSLGANEKGISLPATNTFSEEYIGTPLWGDVPDIQFFSYDSNNPEEHLADVGNALRDVIFAFTLEMTPISVKL